MCLCARARMIAPTIIIIITICTIKTRFAVAVRDALRALGDDIKDSRGCCAAGLLGLSIHTCAVYIKYTYNYYYYYCHAYMHSTLLYYYYVVVVITKNFRSAGEVLCVRVRYRIPLICVRVIL